MYFANGIPMLEVGRFIVGVNILFIFFNNGF